MFIAFENLSSGYFSANDLHCICQSIEIKPATPKLNFIDIPGKNGMLDLTEATGDILYNNPVITIELAVIPAYKNIYHSVLNAVKEKLNGKETKIYTYKSETDYRYYIGRPYVIEIKTDYIFKKITVTATCLTFERWKAYIQFNCTIGLADTVTVTGIPHGVENIRAIITDESPDYPIDLEVNSHLITITSGAETVITGLSDLANNGTISIYSSKRCTGQIIFDKRLL